MNPPMNIQFNKCTITETSLCFEIKSILVTKKFYKRALFFKNSLSSRFCQWFKVLFLVIKGTFSLKGEPKV